VTTYYVRTIINGSPTVFFTSTTGGFTSVTDVFKRDTDNVFSVCYNIGTPPIDFGELPEHRTIAPAIHLANQYPSLVIGAKFYSPTPNRWVAANWTDPEVDYTAWINELCNYFEAIKGNYSFYGEDTGVINLYVFRIYTIYYPVFMKGNDSHADFTVVV
jgi:hypothetical protein